MASHRSCTGRRGTQQRRQPASGVPDRVELLRNGTVEVLHFPQVRSPSYIPDSRPTCPIRKRPLCRTAGRGDTADAATDGRPAPAWKKREPAGCRTLNDQPWKTIDRCRSLFAPVACLIATSLLAAPCPACRTRHRGPAILAKMAGRSISRTPTYAPSSIRSASSAARRSSSIRA